MPRPNIVGTILRRIDLHYSDGRRKDKDYRITVAQEPSGLCRVYYEHGPAGRINQGGEKTSVPIPCGAAMQLADEVSDEKRNGRDRYLVVRDRTFSAPAQPSATTPVRRKASRTVVSSSTLSSLNRRFLATLIF